MRVALVLVTVLVACGSSAAASQPNRLSPSAATAPACAPTTTRDASGVTTADGTTGILGDSWTPAATAMNDQLVLVRKGAREGDRISVRFDDVGHTSPATWVAYDVAATARANPWGEVVFNAGWKPIGFSGSCWRLILDGVDTALVLEVRR